MDTWDRGAPRGTAPPHQVSEQSRRAEEKAQAAQTGSRKASGRRGEVGPLPWLLCTKHRNPAGWGRRAETRTQHPCSGEEAPRPGATRGLRGKARPTTTTTAVPRCRQVRGIPCGAGWGVLGQRQRRGWGAGGVGSYTSGDREAASRNSSEAMLWAPRASLELERPLPEILEREGLGQRGGSQANPGAAEGWGAGWGLQPDKDHRLPPAGQGPAAPPYLGPRAAGLPGDRGRRHRQGGALGRGAVPAPGALESAVGRAQPSRTRDLPPPTLTPATLPSAPQNSPGRGSSRLRGARRGGKAAVHFRSCRSGPAASPRHALGR